MTEESKTGEDFNITYTTETIKLCECGGKLRSVEGLDGSFCVKCGKYYEVDAPKEKETSDNETVDMETVKAYRGVPMHELVFGTEGRGKMKILIPFYFSERQSRAMIDQQIRLLQYTKQQCKINGLDIESKR